jgi:hypothetical protein
MKIEYDVPIIMDDGNVLRADVFHPDDSGRHAVLLSYGAYGEGLAFTVRGRDYEYDGAGAAPPHASNPMKGVGPFLHNNLVDLPKKIFGDCNALHFAGDRQPNVLLPVIPGA